MQYTYHVLVVAADNKLLPKRPARVSCRPILNFGPHFYTVERMNTGTSNLAHKLIMIGTREGRGQVSDHFFGNI